MKNQTHRAIEAIKVENYTTYDEKPCEDSV